ncbi:cytochrome c [Soonwooa buanensis]|uniref:Cytochrome c n=1 Tax=Soonwooa buanensis TaxID=619805 RepID=A0A1T5F200_9FLAO|nr:c-type cytochrome [Soonwooa buanensis]SKB90212.1 cytochrome c [Soonwooa buanensis]
MKKILLVAVGLLVFSCSKKAEATDSKESTTLIEEPKQEEAKLTPLEEGKSLVEGADCLACHKVNEKMIGPAYEEVAAKYENTPENIDALAEKIIQGSSGVWGNVPMAAHPGLSKENAKLMASYVLSLKK